MSFNSPPPNGMNMPPCSQLPTWPQHQQGPYLPQPPFMPPNVVGNLEPCWNQPLPFLSMPFHQEQNHSFPFSPNRQQQSHHYGKRHFNSNNVTSHAKKAKLKGPNFIGFCDVCDRGFKNEEKKKQHYAEHTVCTEPGCSFEAHYKIVEIHKRNLHGPNGVKINLTTPEEIMKWREERRKKFPTSTRVKDKLEEEVKKESSGAVLQDRSFGKFRHGKQGNRFQKKGEESNNPKRSKNLPTDSDVNHGTGAQSDKTSPNPDGAADKPDNPLDAILELTPPASEETGKQSFVGEPSNCSVQSTGTSLDSLSQLMLSYVSDDDDDEVSDDDTGTKTSTNIADDESTPPVITTEASSPPVTKPLSRGPRKRDNKENKRNHKPPSRLSRPSLLQMLLEPEIRKERNDILQCVRYIVQNNFFKAIEQ